MVNARRKFTKQQIQYLRTLPAVANVTAVRITYSDRFRTQATARYLSGDSPVRIFREAGLDPKIIGYKRIERAFARWKLGAKSSPGVDRGWVVVEGDGRASDASEADGTHRLTGFDLRDRLIADQALQIAQLKEYVGELERELDRSVERADETNRTQL
ncbi:HTH domain-containing protein [Bifidobacterium oedipodis]|uniref:Uncharacterized protein n=1 Tax=Bifidobacterium oedipodis TaxID=2675322 RepID=A0A7Y0HSZ1_9BIFI|nr:HTH domain-containing protein [Bifidobacterium sp. DSM 109957]NMM94501.1 hypothetical protein [Bifidobacterium sp. DSM 109957]